MFADELVVVKLVFIVLVVSDVPAEIVVASFDAVIPDDVVAFESATAVVEYLVDEIVILEFV